jgi:hypothetical protein
MDMTTPNRDAFKDKDSFAKFVKKNSIGFSQEQMLESLKRPSKPFHESPNNPWNQLKKEQEDRESGNEDFA